MHNDANSINCLCEMSIKATLNSNHFLPISTDIESFFRHEKFQYHLEAKEENSITDEVCLYDAGFALVKQVDIWTSSDTPFNTISIETEKEAPTEVQYTAKRTTKGVTCFSWDLSRIVNRISLPEEGQLRNIVRMKITGRELYDLQNIYETLLSNYKELDEEWQNKLDLVNNSQKEISEINEEIRITANVKNQLKEQSEEHQHDIDKKLEKIEELESTQYQLSSDLSGLIEEVGEYKDKLFELKDEHERTITRKNALKDQLETVKDELHRHQIESFRYSEDFDTFKQELTLQNTLFMALLVFFLIIGSCLAYSLVDGSYGLLREFNSGVNIYELMISRIPSVLIHSMIIFFLGKWITFVIEGLMSNLNDLKKLKQLVYLVREVTETQSIGLDVGDDPNLIYKARVSEKMAIVRDALCISPKIESVTPTNGDKTSMAARFVGETTKTTLS